MTVCCGQSFQIPTFLISTEEIKHPYLGMQYMWVVRRLAEAKEGFKWEAVATQGPRLVDIGTAL